MVLSSLTAQLLKNCALIRHTTLKQPRTQALCVVLGLRGLCVGRVFPPTRVVPRACRATVWHTKAPAYEADIKES
jgi:hypothetical protein